MHPLVDNLDTLKDNELETKIHELTRKYWQTSNYDVQNQIAMVLEMYKNEFQQRRQTIWKKQYQEKGRDLDSLININ
jgi:hypothetical protein